MSQISGDEQHPRVFDKNITYQSMVDLSSKLFGYLFLANGGAVIALLTLTGHFKVDVQELGCYILFYWFSFASFVIGIIFSMIATGFAYYTQYQIFRHDKAGSFFFSAVMLSVLGLLSFLIGSIFGAIFVARILG